MFPLAGKTFPSSSEELVESIRGALSDLFTLPKPQAVAKATGGEFPEIRKLVIDLDEARVTATEPPPTPKPAGKRSPGITVAQLEVSGHPIRYEQGKVDISLTAKGVTLDFAKDKGGHPLLVLKDAAEGQADAKVSKDDLEAILLAVAGAAAKQQGVTIQDIDVELTSQGPRSVAANVRVVAKKAIVKGTVHLAGRVEVDDELNATVSDLSCTGDGMIGKMAAGLIKGRLEAFNGRRFPLMTFSLGDVTLRDVKVDTKRGLHVTAKFGSK